MCFTSFLLDFLSVIFFFCQMTLLFLYSIYTARVLVLFK